MPYYVYIILCKNKSFYTGYTKNLRRRMTLHSDGKGAHYTKVHRPLRLVYTEELRTRADAMRREKRIKKLTHAQKRKLANNQNKSKSSQKKKKPNQDSSQT